MTEPNYIIIICDAILDEVVTAHGKYVFVVTLKKENNNFVAMYRRQS